MFLIGDFCGWFYSISASNVVHSCQSSGKQVLRGVASYRGATIAGSEDQPTNCGFGIDGEPATMDCAPDVITTWTQTQA